MRLFGVEAVKVEENRTSVAVDGIQPNSIRVTVTGGDEQEVAVCLAQLPPYIAFSGEVEIWVESSDVQRLVRFSHVDCAF